MEPTLKIKRKTEVQNIEQETKESVDEDLGTVNRNVPVEKVVSTGSTLLDLAISGKRRREGGLPGGIIVEIFGPSGGGKTAILSEICGSAQKRGGQVRFCDPEARLDKDYCQIYGVNIKEDFFDYSRPNTVTEMFEKYLYTWNPKDNSAINVFAGDSMAALSTELELGEDGDKRGQRRAKEFSEGLRKRCRMIANNNWLIAFTNQIRQGERGEITPGGFGLPFYASLRIKVYPNFKTGAKITRKISVKIGEKSKEVEKVIGVNSLCTIVKSSIDEPYREAPISIVFGHGIDDIRSNLQYMKDIMGATRYNAIKREYVSLNQAIQCIEENNLELELRENVIELWHKVEKACELHRKKKNRW